jgi:alanyl-tRNA synthetase
VGTERLYYTKCYLADFDANVVSSEKNGTVVYLDRTAFYPTSGGQPHDLGLCGGIPVIDIIDKGDEIAHVLEAPIAAGQVHCSVDWPRRYDHMQQHTGQHLLSAAFAEQCGFKTLSFHLGPDISTIDLETAELSEGEVEQVENRAAQLIREARPVRIGFEEANGANALRKPSSRTGVLRIVEIESLDRSACGGTHVRSTAELGPIFIRRRERLRGNVRVEFVCGDRALARARKDFHLLGETARLCTAAIDDLPRHVNSLRERLAEAEKQRQKLAADLAETEGRRLWESTKPGLDGIRRSVLDVDSIGGSTRVLAQSFISAGQAALLVRGQSPVTLLFAVSPDSNLHAGNLLRSSLQKHGGRGGGSATIAQGTLANTANTRDVSRDLGFEE